MRRNPICYDSEGDELDEDDEDSEADAAAAEENPFSDIALESGLPYFFSQWLQNADDLSFVALLCPLKHPSELPSHPSLSHPYTSNALEQMTRAVETKLRQERALLWRARNLHQQFLGDACWMPCGAIETAEDRWIFEPKIVVENQGASTVGLGVSEAENTVAATGMPDAEAVPVTTASVEAQQKQNEANNENTTTEADVEMTEILGVPEAENANNDEEQFKEPKAEDADATGKDLPPHPGTADNSGRGPEQTSWNGHTDQTFESGENPDEMETTEVGENADTRTSHTEQQPNQTQEETEQDAEMHDGSSPEPPRRMTTRAQAIAANPQPNDSPSSSADTSSTLLPTPHPLFLIPDHVRPDANFGLPPAEAEETRRLLWSYIQKQEETVRGFEHMLNSLLRASHMKSDVLEWCKAEGHVGEMSDGEDWYDREKWGLGEGEELKKGTDEDENETVDESRTTAKRSRVRRA